MRKLIKRTAGWIHTTLILALVAPLLYALAAERSDPAMHTLYFKCLVIILPIIVTDFAIEKCRNFFSYLIICILTFAATSILAKSIADSLYGNVMFWGYMLLLWGETIFVMINRFIVRLHKKEDAKAIHDADPSWRPTYDILREPSFLVLIYFLAAYAFALNLDNPSVCNAALFSAALYTPTIFLYRYVCETENYLSLNKRTCNLPSKRIYGIGNGMLAIFLLLFMFTLLPALLTISGRHYRDLRKSNAMIEINYTELPEEYIPESTTENPMITLMAESGEPKPTPKWAIILTYIMQAVTFLFLIAFLIKKIITTFHDFRNTADDNGDIVEELEETEGAKKITIPSHRGRLSERERIRKEYRKTIRRHRKDRPAAYESPIEIETHAGIAKSAEGKELHKRYELARYGRE